MNKKNSISILSILILLAIWKLSSVLIGADIILPAPEKVILSLFSIIKSEPFITSLLNTLFRGLTGFFLSLGLGLVFGISAGLFKPFGYFIKPVISITRSTPVISVILLALIWFNTSHVPIFVAFLMAFPIVCGSIIEGINTVDEKLIEMANIYKVPLKKQVFKIYIPGLTPFIISGASMSLGIIWKVVVAAEVLSQPKFGLGTSLNEAKAFLITEEVFAWTVIALLLSFITEKLFNLISKKLNWREYAN